jgi:hypothetical protein
VNVQKHAEKALRIERSLAKCISSDYEIRIEAAMLAATHWTPPVDTISSNLQKFFLFEAADDPSGGRAVERDIIGKPPLGCARVMFDGA